MLLVLLLALQNPAPELFYSVTVPTDRSAYLVEMQINNPPHPSRVVIPNWAPGAYRLMDSWQNIGDIVADVLPRIHEAIGAWCPVWDDHTAGMGGIVDLHLDQICRPVGRNRDAVEQLRSGILEREKKY